MAVGAIPDDVVGAEGRGWDEDAKGGVVEEGEAEGVEGTELEYGASFPDAGCLASPVEGCPSLVVDTE